MPSGPKKRRASRRKQAAEVAELVLSTAGATDSCCFGSMETDVAAEVSNDAVQLSQQVEEHVSNTLLEPQPNKGNIGGDMPKENDGSAVPEVVSDVVVCGTCLSEVAVENEIGSMETDIAAEVSNDAVQLSQQVEEYVSNPLMEPQPKGNTGGDVPKENDASEVPEVVSDVVVCGTCLSEVAVENEIGSMETDIAAEVSNVAVRHLFQQGHVIDVVPSTESPVMEKLYNVVQVDQQVEEEHGLQSEVMELVGEDGNVPIEIDTSKSNEGVAVPEVVSSEVGGVVVGDAQLGSKKDNEDIESFTREGIDLPSLNGGCLFVEQADSSQESQDAVFDVMPLKKLNDAVQVEQHSHQESVVMELLLNGKDGNMPNENGCGFSVPEVMPGFEELAAENAIKLASKKDEKHCESVGDDSPSAGVGDDSALNRNFPKLLDSVEQIELLVQEAKGLIIAHRKEQIKCEE